MKSKFLESQKKNFQLQEVNRELQGSLQKAQKERQAYKTELTDLKKILGKPR